MVFLLRLDLHVLISCLWSDGGSIFAIVLNLSIHPQVPDFIFCWVFIYFEFRLYSLESVCSARPYIHKHHSGCRKSQLILAEVTCFRVRHYIVADASGPCKEHQEMALLAFFCLALQVACQLKPLLSHLYPGGLLRVMSIILNRKNILTKGSVIWLLPI